MNIRSNVRDLFSLQKAASVADLHITISVCSYFVRSNRWEATEKISSTNHNPLERPRWNFLGLVFRQAPQYIYNLLGSTFSGEKI